MPATCEGCRYYSAADASGPCPDCGQPLKFTLLPPPDFTDPATVSDEPSIPAYKRPAPRPTSLWYDLVTSTTFLVVCGVALYVVLLGLLWAGIQQGQEAAMPNRR